ncbi:MAG: hypothetical protein Q7T55_20240 [Solirubrobacteraceae bacterium]|nr:hypothetical protein [Solirubrobacteraceae bacterium]
MSAPHTQFEVVRPVDPLERPVRGLTDLAASTDAFDGAIARLDGPDLRVVSSLNGRFSRRTISANHCPAIARAIAGHDVAWLEPSAPEGLYLPLHTQVLFVPFQGADGGRCAALLAYHERVAFTPEEWRSLRSSFELPGTTPPQPSGALRLVA